MTFTKEDFPLNKSINNMENLFSNIDVGNMYEESDLIKDNKITSDMVTKMNLNMFRRSRIIDMGLRIMISSISDQFSMNHGIKSVTYENDIPVPLNRKRRIY
tara:strand:+ start:68 stop:373 length:306 start_codon:yes stop_codon:yes gene_type:complete